MNISLPAINNNILVGLVPTGRCGSKPSGLKNSGQLYKASADDPCLPDTANTTETDNSTTDAGDKLVNESLEGSECILRKKPAAGSHADAATATTCPQTPSQGPARTKRKSQHLASALVPGANPAQTASAKESLTATAAIDMDIPVRTQVPWQQQEMPQTPYKPVQLTNNQSLNVPERALVNDSNGLILAYEQQEGVTNADKAVPSETEAVATEGLVSEQPGPTSVVRVAAANSMATLSDEKPPIANTSPARMMQEARPWQDRFAPLQTEHPDTDQNASAGLDKSALAGDKSAVADMVADVVKAETQILHAPLPQVRQRVTDTEQKTSVGPEKPALPVEKPGDNPAAISREPKPNVGGTASQVFSGSVDGEEQAGNPLRKSFPQQLNVTQFQIRAGQANDRGRPTSGDGASTHFTRAFSSDNSQTLVSDPPPSSAQVAKAAYTVLPSNVSNTMSEQIMESIRGSLQQGDGFVTIRLYPPELGKVVIRFQEQEDRITGSLEVSKAQTRYEIDQALPQIIQTLRDSGVRMERLDVLLTDQSERYTNRDELPQNGPFQQDSPAQGGNSDNKSNYEQLTDPPNGTYQDNPEPQVQIGDDSINVLI